MFGQHFKWWRLRFQFALLACYSLNKSAGLTCDESADIDRKPNPSRKYYYDERDRFIVITKSISIKCSGVELPITSIFTKYNCNKCPYTLMISSSNFLVVPSAAFTNFPLITTLRMENLHIEKLLPGAFNGLHSLEEVYLGGNNITELNPGIFNSLLELKVLDLSKNALKVLGANCFTGTIKMKSLNLSSNFLLTFEESVLDQNIVELDYIDLSFNQITELKIEKTQYSIINIDMSWNSISNMNFCFSGFKSVNISRNKLRSLGKYDCSSFTSEVVNFDVSYNEISELYPDAFVNLSQLERLSIQHNNISSLPIGLFSYLSSLMDLNLSNNNLEILGHGTFESLEKLQYLDISNNKFSSIKRYLHSLVNLKGLNIQGNSISDLDSEQLVKDLQNLKNVNLDGNNFTCDDLIKIIHDFRSRTVNIAYGSARNTSNIHGICCSDNSNSPTGISDNIGSNFEKIILNKLGQLSDQNFKSSAMHEYFNDDFKSSNFYKYLEEMKEQKSLKFNESQIYEFFNKDFENSKFFEYMEKLKDAENSTIELNKSINDYFDKDFRNSSFVKYLENLKKGDDILNGGFLNSEMYKYFNVGFEKSRFYKYLENLNVNGVFSNSSNFMDDFKFGTQVEIMQNMKILFALTLVVLVIIAVILAMLTIMVFNNSQKNKRNHEQVELIDA